MTEIPTPTPGPPPQRRPWHTVAFLALCLLVFLLVAGGLYFLGPRSAPPGVTMADLNGVTDLQTRFNADRGQARLVVILAPT
jgi:hypothetical protein